MHSLGKDESHIGCMKSGAPTLLADGMKSGAPRRQQEDVEEEKAAQREHE